MSPPFSYQFNRWESPHTLCFVFADQDERCMKAEEVILQSSDDDQSGESDQEPDERQRVVQLYYYNADKDTDAQGNVMCSPQRLMSVDRSIAGIQTPITNTVKLLLEGDITQSEQQQGITTEFPLEGFGLEGVNLEEGVATLEFSDPQNSSSGGSCRVTILREQIRQTVLQFDAVDEVRIIPEEILQP
jgi:spore germination protein GerM